MQRVRLKKIAAGGSVQQQKIKRYKRRKHKQSQKPSNGRSLVPAPGRIRPYYGGGRKKGMPRPEGAGRKKGTPNKINTLLKDAIVQAAIAAGKDLDPEARDGLIAYLKAQALVNPPPFMALLGKVLPMQLQGSVRILQITADMVRGLTAAELSLLEKVYGKIAGEVQPEDSDAHKPETIDVTDYAEMIGVDDRTLN